MTLLVAVAWIDAFTHWVDVIDGIVWGVPLIALILFGGVFLTIRLGGLQFRQLPRALRYMVRNESGAKGEVSSFAALCTALSATIGTGNIVGVATAYVTGGPGAIFWMWVAALFGMATKYAEGVLAVRYREHDQSTGRTLGGPFYYIERGMGPRWRWLARAFAVFGVGHILNQLGLLFQFYVHGKPGWVLVLFPRSSLGFRHGVRLSNTAGIIDSDYAFAKNEGHIMVKLRNPSDDPVVIGRGERFCQGLFLLSGIKNFSLIYL